MQNKPHPLKHIALYSVSLYGAKETHIQYTCFYKRIYILHACIIISRLKFAKSWGCFEKNMIVRVFKICKYDTIMLLHYRIKFRPKRDPNPWPLRYRCSALPTELSSQLEAGHVVSSWYTRRWWRILNNYPAKSRGISSDTYSKIRRYSARLSRMIVLLQIDF